MVVVSSLLALVLRGKPNESRLGRYRCLRILLSEVSSVEEHTGFGIGRLVSLRCQQNPAGSHPRSQGQFRVINNNELDQ